MSLQLMELKEFGVPKIAQDHTKIIYDYTNIANNFIQ